MTMHVAQSQQRDVFILIYSLTFTIRNSLD